MSLDDFVCLYLGLLNIYVSRILILKIYSKKLFSKEQCDMYLKQSV